ncbi:hypothetical protein GX48_03551 [Paracoccidioides brasiliensis]|nr:hypothetical protein GX48_03551 [Paracoccidioides brasiliensis]
MTLRAGQKEGIWLSKCGKPRWMPEEGETDRSIRWRLLPHAAEHESESETNQLHIPDGALDEQGYHPYQRRVSSAVGLAAAAAAASAAADRQLDQITAQQLATIS